MPKENEGSVISGVVRNADDQPVGDARVYFTEAPMPLPDIAALTNDKGEYSLSAPASGKYKITCTAGDYAPLTHKVNIKQGTSAKVNFELKS